jgi:hypothetical protein
LDKSRRETVFVHMSIHRPRPDRTDDLAASMHRFGAAADGKPGFLSGHVLRDRKTGRLIGLTLWATEEEWRDALPGQGAVVENDPFDEWESEQPEVFHLDEI